MRRRVRVLDETTINKIAAGEVVERPASVVKELVENSIDANATRITVSIQDGGTRSIEVIDNGEGMDQEDALLALERHATSKIATADDIFQVATLGFRGEALPSIAAVSRFTMVTRTAESSGGTKITVEGGGEPEVRDHPSAPGTSITVNDLFFNTPARRKYLKSASTETRRVIEVVTGEALGHPEVSFSLESNGRRVLFTSGSGDLLQTLGEVIGLSIARSLVRFTGGTSDVSVHGYVSSPSVARSSRRELVFVVNGRPVASGLLAAAVTRAYGTALPKGRYPVGAVVIATDPQKVDVNVHPAKTEVRFADEQNVFSLVTKAVAGAVRSYESYAPDTSSAGEPKHFAERPAAVSPGVRTERVSRSGELFAADGPSVISGVSRQHVTFKSPESGQIDTALGATTQPGSQLSIVGQLWDSYIAVSTEDALLLVDQHAAMERLLHDQLVDEFRVSGLDSQEALIPDTLIVSAAEAETIEERKGVLERLGFRLESFGMRAYLIRAVPSVLDNDEGEDALKEVLSVISGDYGDLSSDDLSVSLVHNLCARLACRSALKANHRLSQEEMERLVGDLFSNASSLYCPHGRPIVASYTRDDIERRVGRR